MVNLEREPTHPFRRYWHYLEYDLVFKDVDTSTLPPISFEQWVPPAVVDEAKKIYVECLNEKQPIAVAEMLSKLISDVRMKRVWTELYRKKRGGRKGADAFVNLVRTSLLATERENAANDIRINRGDARACMAIHRRLELVLRWTEQDLGVQNLLWRIHSSATHMDPEYFSDIQIAEKALRGVAEQLKGVSERLRSKIPALRLEAIVDTCSCAADHLNVDPKTDDPWIIVRDRGINDARLRTFVANMSIAMKTCFGKEMCGTVATLANVVFERDDVSPSRVREMMRLPRDR
jgi:hypothetical protein